MRASYLAGIMAAMLGTSASAGSLAPPLMEAPLAQPAASVAASPFRGFQGYGGLAVGMSNQEITADGILPIGPGLDFDLDLPDLGGQGLGLTLGVGYDVPVSPKVVLGAFADYSRPNVENDASLEATDPGGSPLLDLGYTLTQSSAVTFGARAGYLTSPQTQIYALAGLTRGTWEGELTSGGGELGADALDYEFDNDGVTLGAGIETMVQGNVSLRLEYRFTRYQTYDLIDLDPTEVGLGLDLDLDTTGHSIAMLAGFRF